MSLVEGFGDEVIFCFVVLALIAVFSLAWFSTHVRPIWNPGSVWLVQLQTHPNRQVLQVLSVDERNLDQVPQPANADAGQTRQIIVEPSSAEILTSDEGNGRSDSTSSESDDTGTEKSKENDENRENNVENVAAFERLDDSETSTIKIKFLDDTHKMVRAWLTQTVGQFKREHFTTEVNQGKVIRLIYRGQLLRDDGRSLESYGLHDNCVLHCHVGNVPYAQPATNSPRATDSGSGVGHQQQHGPTNNRNNNNNNNFDIGRYIYVIFGLKFGALWMAWYFYPHFFSSTSVISLVACTGLYGVFLYGGRRNQQQNIAPTN